MSENARRENRIQGIVDRVSSEDDFDSIKWITQAPVQTFCRSAVDETAQKNAELHRDLGIQAKIVRTMTGKENCKWCEGLAGEYEYPDVPDDVYHRHDDCDCVVEYQPGDGSVQDVWSKEWKEAPEDIAKRKEHNLLEEKVSAVPEEIVPETPSLVPGEPNDATEHYVSGNGMWINDYLRNPEKFTRENGGLTPEERIYLTELDTATNGIVQEDVLYRSVDASAIFGNISQMEYERLVEHFLYNSDEPYVKAAVDKFLPKTKGKTVTEKGYLSTTKDYNVAAEWGDFSGSSKPVVLEIQKTKGAKGVDLSKYDLNVEEWQAQAEVLLARGQKLYIKDITSKDGNIVVITVLQ